MKIPIVREDYLIDCLARKKRLPFDMYKVEMIGEASSMVTIKVKGHSVVHEASGLQVSSHILEEGKSIYNTTLNMSDLSTGTNRWVHYVLTSFSWYIQKSLFILIVICFYLLGESLTSLPFLRFLLCCPNFFFPCKATTFSR